MRRLLTIVAIGALQAACAAPAVSAPPAAQPFQVVVEGVCPKLDVFSVGAEVALVHGTYGLRDAPTPGAVTPRQAVSLVYPDGARPAPALLAALPRDDAGYVQGDLSIHGDAEHGLSILRTRYRPPASPGAWLAPEHDWWPLASGPGDARAASDTPEARTSAMAPIPSPCAQGKQIAVLSPAQRGRSHWVVGRCEGSAPDAATSGVYVGHWQAELAHWRLRQAPESAILQGIVNVGIAVEDTERAYVFAYHPYATAESAEPYLLMDGPDGLRRTSVPLRGEIVSMAVAPDGSAWVITNFRSLFRSCVGCPGGWEQLRLPMPPAASSVRGAELRMLDVRALSSPPSVWVHAAVPRAVDDPGGGRIHALYSTLPWQQPMSCELGASPQDALSGRSSGLVAARLRKRFAPDEQ
jgi:hypothetical protein